MNDETKTKIEALKLAEKICRDRHDIWLKDELNGGTYRCTVARAESGNCADEIRELINRLEFDGNEDV